MAMMSHCSTRRRGYIGPAKVAIRGAEYSEFSLESKVQIYKLNTGM